MSIELFEKEQLKSIFKKYLTIELQEGGNMCSDWLEITLLFDGDVISKDKITGGLLQRED